MIFLVNGKANGEVLKLDDPLSFWGGVDPQTGEITDLRHPQGGMSVKGCRSEEDRAVEARS